jgi:hypothetical protein
MLYLFRLLLLLINIDQETVLNWFGVEDRANQEISQAAGNMLLTFQILNHRLMFR